VALSCPITPHPTARFIINNLTNRFYWSRIGASLDGFQLYGVPGAGRTYTAGLDLSF
jgi:catecholate siderophore receptor